MSSVVQPAVSQAGSREHSIPLGVVGARVERLTSRRGEEPALTQSWSAVSRLRARLARCCPSSSTSSSGSPIDRRPACDFVSAVPPSWETVWAEAAVLLAARFTTTVLPPWAVAAPPHHQLTCPCRGRRRTTSSRGLRPAVDGGRARLPSARCCAGAPRGRTAVESPRRSRARPPCLYSWCLSGYCRIRDVPRRIGLVESRPDSAVRFVHRRSGAALPHHALVQPFQVLRLQAIQAVGPYTSERWTRMARPYPLAMFSRTFALRCCPAQ